MLLGPDGGDDDQLLGAYNASASDAFMFLPQQQLEGDGYGGPHDASPQQPSFKPPAQQQAQVQAQAPQQQPQQQQQPQAPRQAQQQAQLQPHHHSQMQQQQIMSQSMQVQGAQKRGAAPAHPPAYEDDNYFEALWAKRRDVVKLIILSLVVLLAVSAHSTVTHYLKEYIESNPMLTDPQQIALRCAYPLAVLFLLWNTKAFFGGRQ